jgi:hypothetical protein
MQNKKAELCQIVDMLIQGRAARRYAEDVAGPEKKQEKEKEIAAEIHNERDDGSGNLDPESKEKLPESEEKLLETILKRGTVTDMWGDRLDGMLSDRILQQVPKSLRSAIVNLNE